MIELKSIDYKIIAELIENSKISDRKLAKKLGVSQPTVTRRRASLEKRGLLEYTAIPNFRKFGLGVMCFMFVAWRPEIRAQERSTEEFAKKAAAFVKENPNIIFVSTGQGLNKDGIAVSFHENFADYVKFRRDFEVVWGRYMSSMESFLISLNSDNILKSPSPRYLAQYFKERGSIKQP